MIPSTNALFNTKAGWNVSFQKASMYVESLHMKSPHLITFRVLWSPII